MITTRNQRAIYQYAVKHCLSDPEKRVDRALKTLSELLPLLGARSHTRPMINRIGIALLYNTVTVIAPSCPDYSHTHGKYDFKHAGSGVPLLSRLHIAFLERISSLVPGFQCEIVVADHEANDSELCRLLGLEQRVFQARVHASIAATGFDLRSYGWQVSAMTDRFPDLETREQRFMAVFRTDERIMKRIKNDTLARKQMYERLGVHDPIARFERTLRTAAQYAAIAEIAAEERLLVCNHETVNLSWYKRLGAGVLHNPVRVY